jgi:hypothetical protein
MPEKLPSFVVGNPDRPAVGGIVALPGSAPEAATLGSVPWAAGGVTHPRAARTRRSAVIASPKQPGTGLLAWACEITGLVMTPDQRTMFVNIQHPGESTSHWNAIHGAPTPANPSTVSSWPYGRRPRPATVVIRKDDGGCIGT